jgi:hypothetical protein
MPHRHSLLQNFGESFVQLVDKLTRSVSVQLDGLAFLAGNHSGVPTKRIDLENPVAMYVKVKASGVIYFIVQSLAKWGHQGVSEFLCARRGSVPPIIGSSTVSNG